MVVVAQLVTGVVGSNPIFHPQGHDNSHDVNIIKSTSGRLIERLDAHSR